MEAHDDPIRAFRDEHESLMVEVEHLARLARELEQLEPAERADALDASLHFLRHTLLPHAELEERVLYPHVATLIGEPDAVAPMVYDHLAIAELVERLEATSSDDVELLRELLYGLAALIGAHFRKEEEIYLPVIERQPRTRVREIFDQMAAAHGHH